MEQQKRVKKTLTTKDLIRIVKAKVGAGFTTPIIEKAVMLTLKEIVNALFEGKRVKLGNITLRAKIQEEKTTKKFKRPDTGEEVEKEILPHIKIVATPRKIEFSNPKEREKIKQEFLKAFQI